jgi:UDP-N-acetylmuramate--alanine ligase
VLDIYPAREDPIPGVSSELIAEHLGAGGRLVGPGRDAVGALVAAAAPGDIVLTAGAGDVTAYGPLIVDALTAVTPESGTLGSGSMPSGAPDSGAAGG